MRQAHFQNRDLETKTKQPQSPESEIGKRFIAGKISV